MAIYTLSTSANYSAIKGSLANGDTIRIDTDAVRLTVNEQPLLTHITVDTPGKSGRMTVSGAYDLSTWTIIAGTVSLIDGTFPAGATLGSATGGSGVNSYGVLTNAGTIAAANGGTGGNSQGVATNNGTVTTATAGSGTTSVGVGTNNGTIETATAGSANSVSGVNVNNGTVRFANGAAGVSAYGVATNNGTVGTATGGSVAGSHGVNLNNSTVTKGIGGSNASSHGVNASYGIVLQADDNTGRGVNSLQGGPKLIIGPNYQTGTTAYSSVPKSYSIGEVSQLAAIPGTIEIVLLSEGTGSAGFTGIQGTSRRLGT